MITYILVFFAGCLAGGLSIAVIAGAYRGDD